MLLSLIKLDVLNFWVSSVYYSSHLECLLTIYSYGNVWRRSCPCWRNYNVGSVSKFDKQVRFVSCRLLLIPSCRIVSLPVLNKKYQLIILKSYAFLIDSATYVYVSEIFPTHIRAKGMAVSTSGLFIAALIFLSSAPTAFAAIGWKYYLVFTITSFVTVLCIVFLFPEVWPFLFSYLKFIKSNS